MKRINVIHVIDTLNMGGAERVTVDLINLLYRDGISVALALLLKSGPLEENIESGIEIFCLNRKDKFSFKMMKDLSRELSQFTIVHIHMRHVMRYVMMVKIFFPFNSKIVFHDHSSNMDRTVKNFFFKKLVKNIDAYIGTNIELCEWAEKYVGIQKEKIWFLPNIVFSKTIIHKKIEDSSVISFVVVSNFRKEKNIEFIIELLSEIKKRYSVKLDIYGQKLDDEYMEYIMDMIEKKRLSGDINIITDCFNIQEHLYQYNMALHCAKFETGPLVLIEYLAQGVPFLSYKTGEVVKVVEKYFPDMIIDTFDVKKWADVIYSQLEYSRTYNIENELKAIYKRYFSPEDYLKQCKVIYKSILSS